MYTVEETYMSAELPKPIKNMKNMKTHKHVKNTATPFGDDVWGENNVFVVFKKKRASNTPRTKTVFKITKHGFLAPKCAYLMCIVEETHVSLKTYKSLKDLVLTPTLVSWQRHFASFRAKC